MEFFNTVVKPLFDVLEKYGIEILLLVSIILATWLTKIADKTKKHESRYVWIPIIYAAAGVLIWHSAVPTRGKFIAWLFFWLKDTMVYGLLASGAFNFYSRTIKAKRLAKKAGGAS